MLFECLMAEARDPRQLLAIMFTDVVGYTALTERDEAAAVRVRDQHRERVHTLVKPFGLRRRQRADRRLRRGVRRSGAEVG